MGFIRKATISDARQGKDQHDRQIDHEFPISPGQNKRGKNGASVVSVPASTGINISPAAALAAIAEEIFPFPSVKIRCVFSITTIASSTIIPNPKQQGKEYDKIQGNMTADDQIGRR